MVLNQIATICKWRYSLYSISLLMPSLILASVLGYDYGVNEYFILILSAVLIVGLGFIIKTLRKSFTSLIGLMYCSCALFIWARPAYAIATRDYSIFSITFGNTAILSGKLLCNLFMFWDIGIAAFFGGYMCFYKNAKYERVEFKTNVKSVYKIIFLSAIVFFYALLPFLVKEKIQAFSVGGYTALYMAQTGYSFNITRLVGFLCPLVFGLSIVINEKAYEKVALATVAIYAAAGLMVGQRIEAGIWIMTFVWYASNVKSMKISIKKLVILFIVVGAFFESIEIIRERHSIGRSLITEFIVSQGVTFLLPSLMWNLPSPPMHAVLGEMLPLGGLYNLIGIGTTRDYNIANYICAQNNPALFDAGYGLGSSAFIDMYYLCLENYILYAIGCFIAGIILCKIEKMAFQKSAMMLLLSVITPTLFAVQRRSIETLTSSCIYLIVPLALVFVCEHRYIYIKEI